MAEPRYEEAARSLRAHLAACPSLLVAFSGGLDSTWLAYAAHAALGARALAVTLHAEVHPAREVEEARALAGRIGIRHRVEPVRLLDEAAFRENPPERCYHCKRLLFERLLAIAREEGCAVVAEGTTVDDAADHRPGMRAVSELGIRSPLAGAGLTKAMIRTLSRAAGLPTWDKPPAACLASRVPYGTPVTLQTLRRIERAEEALRALGLRTVRVRDHGAVGRIEVAPEAIPRLGAELRGAALEALREAGYAYAALDLAGYRTGSLNETLPGPGAAGGGADRAEGAAEPEERP